MATGLPTEPRALFSPTCCAGRIIGLGNVALHAHVPGWLSRRDVEIVAVSDADPSRQALGARHLPDARWCETADRLLADAELDFVDICTPPSSHAALIRTALSRGLHVLCEKPLVGSPRELRALTELALRQRSGAPHGTQLAPRAHRSPDARPRGGWRHRAT